LKTTIRKITFALLKDMVRAVLAKTMFALTRRAGFFHLGPLRINRRQVIPISNEHATVVHSHYSASEAIFSKVRFFASASKAGSRREYPALTTWKVGNAIVGADRRTNFVFTGEAALIAPRSESGPWRTYWGHSSPVTGGIWGQQGHEIVQFSWNTMQKNAPTGIFVGTLSPHNWYHWLCQTLPTLFLTRALSIPSTVPLILHSGTFPDDKWRESFDLLDIKREILFIKHNHTLAVNHLYWTDAPTDRGPFAPSLQHPVSIHGPAFRDFQNFLLDQVPALAKSEARTPTRIMLIRSVGATRPYNQDEIVAIAKEYGFVPIALERFSFPALVKLFRGSEKIIGPHGASFANIMFCNPGTRILQWQAENSTGFNDYSSLAVHCGLDFRVLPTQLINGGRNPVGGQWLNPVIARDEISAL
jgi:hypothetical protein